MSPSGAVDVAPSFWFLGTAHQPSAAAGVALYSQQPSILFALLQFILQFSAWGIWKLERGFGIVIANLHGLTTGTAESWGWRKDAVYLVAWATNAVILILLYQVFDIMKSRLFGSPQQRLRALQGHYKDLRIQFEREQHLRQELAETAADLRRQINNIHDQQRTAFALRLDPTRGIDLTPLLDFVPIADVGADGVAAADVSEISKMEVFRGFRTISNGPISDTGQVSAMCEAVTLLTVMLRSLAATGPTEDGVEPLRKRVRTVLLRDFVDKVRPWSTLNDRMYTRWIPGSRLDVVMTEMVSEERLRLVPRKLRSYAGVLATRKYTRVAAMQMLALLMHNGCVLE